MDLNPQQNEIINHSQGPLLIIAGAGSGKTRAITSNIVNLLKSGIAKPDEILALTFTDKAATEMSRRVDEQLPLGYEEICIKTFHSFAEHILRESGLEIGIDPGFTILNKIKQWFFFKKNLFAFNLDYYRPLGNPNKFIYMLMQHFSKLKDELITPDKYLDYATKLQGEEGEKMQEIANAYKVYQELLIKNNYMDFGDLVYFAIKLFSERKSVLKQYQDRYKFIFIDEFQDTNYDQYVLISMLAEAHENIVVVGDDDQSIYKWRGASLSNIIKFQEKFPAHKKIVLTENYRSGKNILDSAYSLIQNNNPDRLEFKSGINKQLKCNKDYQDQVETHHFPNFLQECSFVAEKIKSLREKEGANFSDFAVLIRSNKLANPFVEEFKYMDVPYQVRNPKGLTALEEIKDLVAVVKFLSNPSNDVALLRILKIDAFEISMADILKILGDKKENIFYKLQDQEDDKIKNLSSFFKGLIEFSKKNPVGIVLNEFLQKSGYIKFLIKNDKFEEMENINEFAKQVNRFEEENEDKSVLDFESYLNLLDEADAPFSYEEFADKDAVQILTVHGAKGLEFKYVFIINAVNQRFPGPKKYDPFVIPEKLTNEIYPEGDYRIQEERRLFYVAMTRAEKNLFITYSDRYEGNRKWKVSPFVGEVMDSGNAVLTEHKETEDALKKLKTFKEPQKSIFKLSPFKKNHISFSQFDVFKKCPLKYNYRYIMNVPLKPSHASNFGTSIHNTLKQFYKLLMQGVKVDLKTLETLYEKNWIPFGYDTKEHENIRKKKGLKILQNFYDQNSSPWVVPSFVERKFNLKIDDILVTGRIDRIDKLSDGTYEIIDYKTGKLSKTLKIDKDLQLSIYALACRDIFKIPVSKLSLYCIENGKKVSTKRTDEELNKVGIEIQKLIKEIRESNFPAKPGYLCKFCDFKLICPAA